MMASVDAASGSGVPSNGSSFSSLNYGYFNLNPGKPIFSDGRNPTMGRKKHPPHFPTGTTEVLTFYPTMDEFKNFNAFILKVEQEGAHNLCGIAKIIPPEGWNPRPSKTNYDDVDSYEIASPVKEIMDGRNGVYKKCNEIFKNKMTVKEFRHLANTSKYRPPKDFNGLEGKSLENFLFDHILTGEPIYGADTEGSIYDETITEFNMNRLGTVLDDYKVIELVRGVNTVYLYFGMFKTCFPWHAEDMDLYSINYLHCGAPKYWFAIPAEGADRFEKLLDQLYPDWKTQCKGFPRHKLCMISPEILRIHNIPYGTMIQRPGEFIITFPRGYHMGFNLGYNIAESTNFAADRWIDYGKNIVACTCKESVLLDMEIFMKKYRPDELFLWQKYWFRGKYKFIESWPYPFMKKKRGTHQDQTLGDRLKRARGNWKRQQAHLNCRTSPDLYNEKIENELNAKYPPHCAVCLLFYNKKKDAANKVINIPKRSTRLAKASFFHKSSTPLLTVDPREEELLTCNHCCVTVHPSCCGGDRNVVGDWKCPRCRERSDVAIRFTTCNLCEQRAGAMIPCETGIDQGFVHVTCAIISRRTTFDRAIGPTRCKTYPSFHKPRKGLIGFMNLAYIQAELDFMEKFRWNCDICQTMREGLVMCSLCQDSVNSLPDSMCPVEATMAHTTCGKSAGFLFEERTFPQVTAMVCDRHIFFHPDGLLDIGNTVYVKTSGGYVPGIIKSIASLNTQVVTVTLLNGRYLTKVSVDRILECDCDNCDGWKHCNGSKLRISTDNGEEDCYFRHAYTISEYEVATKEGVTIYFRDSLIGPNEQISLVKRKADHEFPKNLKSPKIV